jgi:hypothetical protein
VPVPASAKSASRLRERPGQEQEDGRKYLIKHRAANGDIHTVTDWTEHATVAKQDAAGKATNALAVEAGDFGVRLFVNGTRVAEFLKADVPYLQTDGVVGLRINHNLDVHVAGFRVVKQ